VWCCASRNGYGLRPSELYVLAPVPTPIVGDRLDGPQRPGCHRSAGDATTAVIGCFANSFTTDRPFLGHVANVDDGTGGSRRWRRCRLRRDFNESRRIGTLIVDFIDNRMRALGPRADRVRSNHVRPKYPSIAPGWRVVIARKRTSLPYVWVCRARSMPVAASTVLPDRAVRGRSWPSMYCHRDCLRCPCDRYVGVFADAGALAQGAFLIRVLATGLAMAGCYTCRVPGSWHQPWEVSRWRFASVQRRRVAVKGNRGC
jgi:hypothetical protein